MTAQLQSTSRGQTLVLTVSNPGQHNALEPAMFAAGIEALNGAESNAQVRSVVITGAGATFCTGTSPQHLQTSRQTDAQVMRHTLDGLHGWIETIRAYPKPVIAAVEGTATDAGFALALACDLVVAGRDAAFSMGYSALALSPGGGASWSLAQALPRQLAAELLLCGERITADRLHALGMVNRLSDPGSALATALALAQELNARAPNALASTKELLNEAPQHTLAQHLAAERQHFIQNLFHANAGESIRAFLEKRLPRYR